MHTGAFAAAGQRLADTDDSFSSAPRGILIGQIPQILRAKKFDGTRGGASMAGSILIPPEVKIHTWKHYAQGAALLSANVTRIDVTGYVLLFQDASEFLH